MKLYSLFKQSVLLCIPLLLSSHLAMAQDPLFISPSGNVGIGTTDPKSMLHLSGVKPELTLQTTGTYPEGGQYILQTSAPSGIRLTTFNIIDKAKGVTRFGIDKDGNVGIGTTEPHAFLDVNGNTWVKGMLAVNGKVGFGTIRPKTILHVADTTPEISIESIVTGGRRYTLQSGKAVPGITATFQIVDRTAVACRLGIDADGNTGINTSAPGATLDVNGSMKINSWASQSASANGFMRMGEIAIAWGTVDYKNNNAIQVTYNTGVSFSQVFSVTATVVDDAAAGGGDGANVPCKVMAINNSGFQIGGTRPFSGDNRSKVKWMAIGK